MKIVRHFTAFLLALVMLLGLCSTAFAADSASVSYTGYTDVAIGAWHEKYVQAMTETGIMNGTGQGKFSPTTACTRAMFVTILYRLADAPAVKAASAMKDVVSGSWYANAVAWAQESGVTTGYTDGTFGVNDTLTRQQMVTFLYRFAKHMGDDVTGSADISGYTDAASVQSWAKEAIQWAVSAGVIQGTDKGLEPDAACTRAMAATVISRLEGLVDEMITRAQMEEALVETAWTYYMKGPKIQYCGRVLDEGLIKWWGGTWRQQVYSKVEDATSDYELFSVCSEYMYSVYDNAFNYPLFGARVNQMTHGTWYYSGRLPGLAVLRWVTSAHNNGTGTFDSADQKWGLTDNSVLSTTEEMLAFLKDWDKNLRPGDIFTYYSLTAGNGHNLMYIGNGYILDSTGTSYDLTSGTDAREVKGTVSDLDTVEDVFLNTSSSYSLQKLADSGTDGFFCVLRPLNTLCIDNGDGDPANDLLNTSFVLQDRSDLKHDPNTQKSGYTITNATKSRLKYPGMEIDRTVDITPYGTAVTGDTLTYSVKISNKSNDSNYTKYQTAARGAAYSGEDYTGLTVKETIPSGTELVSVPSGATLNGNTLTWKVDIAAGKSVDLTYTVKVTAPQGETIVNNGGWVAYIPSNTIKNIVGGAKLSADKQAALASFAAAGVDKWNSNDGYKISAKSTDTAFAERVYNEGMGMDLQLPTAQELLDNLFAFTEFNVTDGYGSHKGESVRAWMYVLKDNAGDYQRYRDMVIRSYAGGLGVHTDRYAGVERINSFRTDYLEPGDIIIHGNLDGDVDHGTKRNVTDTEVIVYLGNGAYATLNSANEMRLVTDESAIWKAHSYDFFIGLRPSQGYANINTEVVAYDKTKSAALTDADANQALDLWSQESLQKCLANITLSSWEANRSPANQINFALWVYNFCGLNISDKLTQNIAYTVRGLWSEKNSQYVLKDTPSSECAGEKVMLVDGAWGGTKGASGDKTKLDSADDFQVGDLVGMYKKDDSNNSCYGMAVYMGNNQFFYANYVPNIKGSNKAVFCTFEELQAAWGTNAWWLYYVLRPSQAYTGENAVQTVPPTTETTPGTSGWNIYYVLRPSQAVSGLDMTAHADTLKKLTVSDWASGGKKKNQRDFGKWVYSTIGVDLTDVLTQNISYTVGMKAANGVALFELANNVYVKTTGTVADMFAGEAKMLVADMYGGGKTAGGDQTKMKTLASYQPGDLISFMTIEEDKSYTYGTAAYMGDGNFLFVTFNSSVSTSTKAEVITFEQMKAEF